MAASKDKSIHDLNGRWYFNKTLSDSAGLDAVLICQGVGWLLRRAIAIASITAHTYQTEEDGVVTITIHNTSNGGIKGTTEVRHLNGKPTEHTDYIWGHVRGSSRYVATRDLKDDFLKTGWLSETSDGECIENTIEALDGSWTSCMVWGFEPVKGERRLVRHVTARRGQQSATSKLVYDYLGPTR